MSKAIKVESCFFCPYMRMFENDDNVYCSIYGDGSDELINMGHKDKIFSKSDFIFKDCELEDYSE